MVNSRLGHILYRFRDIATKTADPEIVVLLTPVSFDGLASTDVCVWNSIWQLYTATVQQWNHIHCMLTCLDVASKKLAHSAAARGDPTNLCMICTSLKFIDTALSLCCWHYGSVSWVRAGGPCSWLQPSVSVLIEPDSYSHRPCSGRSGRVGLVNLPRGCGFDSHPVHCRQPWASC